MRIRSRAARAIPSVAVLTTLLAMSLAAPASAGVSTTWQYPSVQCPVNDDHGLQDCIDAADAGDTIELTAEIIDEGAFIVKSITIRPTTPDLMPHVLGFFIADATSGSTDTPGGEEDVDVHLSDMKVAGGISVQTHYGILDHVTLTHLVVGKGSAFASGITISADSPVIADVERSWVRTEQHQQGSLELYTDQPGTSTLIAIGNELTQRGSTDSGSGIDLTVHDGSSIVAHILGNSIHDVVQDSAGGASGIVLYATEASHARVDIVGNTLDHVGSDGILIRGEVSAGGHANVTIFNNIVTNADGSGIALDENIAGTLTAHLGFNATHGNGSPNFLSGHPAGPGNRTDAPRYRDAAHGDLRLKATSPLIDRGRACTIGGQAPIDAAGHFRWAGEEVDIGAYETGAGTTGGVVKVGDAGADHLVGTSGRDILCGLGGKDTLEGGGGPDLLDGGPANDRIVSGPGADRAFGGDGADTLCSRDGVNGNDLADGGPGDDAWQHDPGDRSRSVEHTASC